MKPYELRQDGDFQGRGLALFQSHSLIALPLTGTFRRDFSGVELYYVLYRLEEEWDFVERVVPVQSDQMEYSVSLHSVKIRFHSNKAQRVKLSYKVHYRCLQVLITGVLELWLHRIDPLLDFRTRLPVLTEKVMLKLAARCRYRMVRSRHGSNQLLVKPSHR